MLFRLFTSPRPSLPPLLLRHYSIKVLPLKKHSLFSQILRHGASPTPSKAAPKGVLRSEVGLKPIPLRASVSSLEKQLPPPVSSKLSVFANVKDQDGCPTEEKDLSNGSAKSRADCKGAHHSNYGFVRPLKEGRSTLCSHDDELLLMGCQKVEHEGKHSDTDAHEGRTLVPVQLGIPETKGHHSPVERRRKTSKVGSSKAYIASGNSMETFPRVGSSQKHDCLAPEFGDECRDSTIHAVGIREGNEGHKEIISAPELASQNVHVVCDEQREEQEGVPSTECLKDYSGIVNEKTNDFRENLQAKIGLLQAAFCQPAIVEELLDKSLFLSASPEELAAVLKFLTGYFESSEMDVKTFSTNMVTCSEILVKLEGARVQSMARLPVRFRNQMANLNDNEWKSVTILLKELGLSAESIRDMIIKHPLVLRQSVSEVMRPVVDFLKNLDVPTPSLLRLIESRPFLLSLSLKNKVLPFYAICQRFGLSDEVFLLTLRPTDCCDGKRIVALFSVFQERGVSEEDITAMIEKLPRILMMSPESIRTYLDYVVQSAKLDILEIVSCPTCFSYSLTRRVIPRMKLVEELGKPIPLAFSSIITLSNASFAKWYRGQS